MILLVQASQLLYQLRLPCGRHGIQIITDHYMWWWYTIKGYMCHQLAATSRGASVTDGGSTYAAAAV